MTITRSFRGSRVCATPASTWSRVALVVLSVALVAGCTSIIPGDPIAETGAPAAQQGTAGAAAGEAEGDTAGRSSADLIDAALAAGEIDEPTSWLYRTWAAFDDPQLPAPYAGAPGSHDIGVLAELPGRLDELPDDIRAQVEPYLVRPTDPRSIHAPDSERANDPPGFRQPGTWLVDSDLGVDADADVDPDLENPKSAWNACLEGWDTEVVPGLPFRVWACKDLNFVDMDNATATADAMTRVSQMIQKVAPKMLADMGDLTPDLPGSSSDARSDELIDLYVLKRHRNTIRRDGVLHQVDHAGAAIGTGPFVGATCSAFMVISSEFIYEPLYFEWVVVHELFHALQYTHHTKIKPRWIYDATADWATSYYARGVVSRELHRNRLPIKHGEWHVSLESGAGMHAYGAYVWPLFMEQQVGAASIFALWDSLASAPVVAHPSDLLAALDEQLPVSGNYPEFAMRVLNLNVAGEPISPRFVHVDGQFPDGQLPRLVEHALGDDVLELPFANMQGLSYRPYRILVPPNNGKSTEDGVLVKIIGTARTSGGPPPVLEGVLTDPDGTWRRQSLPYSGDGTTVCVGEMNYLMLSNPANRLLYQAEGVITLERLEDEPCSRVEVNHPRNLTRLQDGEQVTVVGTENDGAADSSTIVVTVHDVEATKVGDHAVEVTVTGGTLTAPRTFQWSLAEFTQVGEQEWRREEPLSLDVDLTEANRPLTIAAELLRKDSTVDEHAPTIELHGEKACGVIDPDGECELVGALYFSFSGDYDGGPNIHPRDYASASVEAAIDLRLREAQLADKVSPTFPLIDAGSTWQLSGSARFETCSTIAGGTCAGAVTQTFHHADGHSPDPGRLPAGLQFAISRTGKLSAQIPVITTGSAPTRGGPDVADPPETQMWGIGCSPDDDTGIFWESGMSYTDTRFAYHDVWGVGSDLRRADGGGDLLAKGADLVIDCSRTWGTGDFNLSRSGGTAAITVRLHGKLTWQRPGQ